MITKIIKKGNTPFNHSHFTYILHVNRAFLLNDVILI